MTRICIKSTNANALGKFTKFRQCILQITLKFISKSTRHSTITVHNAILYEKNQYGRYGVNDRTAKRNDDGSVTIHFGGDATSHNHVPIVEGWNYVVRLYRPREEILDGTWTFPGVSKVSDI